MSYGIEITHSLYQIAKADAAVKYQRRVVSALAASGEAPSVVVATRMLRRLEERAAARHQKHRSLLLEARVYDIQALLDYRDRRRGLRGEDQLGAAALAFARRAGDGAV